MLFLEGIYKRRKKKKKKKKKKKGERAGRNELLDASGLVALVGSDIHRRGGSLKES
jgi:hypothetical protein